MDYRRDNFSSDSSSNSAKKNNTIEEEEEVREHIQIVGSNYEEAMKATHDDDDDVDRSNYTQEVAFVMPDMDMYDDDGGRVVKWYKESGDLIRRGDTICDVALEAFTFGMDSDDEGVTIMGEIHVPENHPDPVMEGTTLCTILHAEEDDSNNDEVGSDDVSKKG
eukprot:CAMPEP_0195518572 /NCGR_PEP_ID=MMETSP0794_2-20130614/13198_1 /TAXON_ID=515487 /ORGANISM="Stephanopyxis turris, Strain CCMP 815" /LENGTH=163 /DNA_ID=CAMNT_0040647571 /DNA_START=176 /DNA_END=667 /DNA_ORIENTATION=+